MVSKREDEMRHLTGAALAIAIFASAGGSAAGQVASQALAGTTRSDDYNAVVQAYRTRQTRKIVGGQPAPDNAFPYQVSLQVSWIADPGAGHFCGGSIYKLGWIITAAHCVVGLNPDEVVVTAGSNSLNHGIRRTNVRRIIQHPAYVHATKDSDIALLELATPLQFNDRIQPIPLISDQDEGTFRPNTPLVVTGWGATQSGGDTVRDLRFVSVDFVPNATCNQPLSYNGRITLNMLCAGPAGGGQDSCQGDSGGPLAARVAGAPRLAGVVSWGHGCAIPLKYGVYARVTPFASWINQYAR
jgi:secreted trypsin-like serine protease